jgi:hypothetical protein
MHCGAEVTESSTNKQHHLSKKNNTTANDLHENLVAQETSIMSWLMQFVVPCFKFCRACYVQKKSFILDVQLCSWWFQLVIFLLGSVFTIFKHNGDATEILTAHFFDSIGNFPLSITVTLLMEVILRIYVCV